MTLSVRSVTVILVLLGLALVPPIASWVDQGYYTVLFARMLIMSIAAIALNLILGFGGMVSFGHAAFLGVGGYVAGIFIFHYFEDGAEWMGNGYVQLAATIVASALVALFIGAICLRTRGVYFIMITLAFGQMLFFVAVGLEIYGGDDGLSLYTRSEFPGLFDLNDRTTLYYVSYGTMLACLLVSWRLINSRFGMVLRGARLNDRRMKAIGFPTYPYRLVAFVISGVMTGIAGFLLANQTDFVSPSMMHWTKSGDLIIIVVLGGMGTLFGPLFGTIAYLLLEDILPSITESWQLFFGPMLILVVLFARGGIDSLLGPRSRPDD
ncbi:branched-chain amino acid ABC transporter permease [Oceanibacterium hippocampi]|uniref:Leucine/isoleucine/valine transporter permease subunit n=1 Tax=Oceanibacterium hippocampi TaxID=745714 RepID=A0A1Y5U551_9PROT|nr:branched-chain amino acid ABC transporter permease [Oceanibacterium hippocampi]SLN77424.1 leucine/isoleucine/valine transporter permease subunit [Oceanibacterium hippocampi]